MQPVPKDQPDIDPIGRPIVHRSALQQTTGEAVYVDDLPTIQGLQVTHPTVFWSSYCKIRFIGCLAAISENVRTKNRGQVFVFLRDFDIRKVICTY